MQRAPSTAHVSAHGVRHPLLWNASNTTVERGLRFAFIGDSMLRPLAQQFGNEVASMLGLNEGLWVERASNGSQRFPKFTRTARRAGFDQAGLGQIAHKYAAGKLALCSPEFGSWLHPPSGMACCVAYVRTNLDAHAFDQLQRWADVLVLHVGAWFSPLRNNMNEYLPNIEKYAAALAGQRARGGLGIWVEYSAVHFPSASGECNGCIGSPPPHPVCLNYPNESIPAPGSAECVTRLSATQLGNSQTWFKRLVPNQVMRRYGVLVMETFEETVGKGREHVGFPDCRHWELGGPVLRRQASKLMRMIS